jgi:hypothetical protein
MMTVTDRQTLLRAVRRGDFRALLALSDLWAEQGDGLADDWAKLLDKTRWHLANRDRVKMGVLESMTRWFRDFAYMVNRVEDGPWRLPPIKNCVGTFRRADFFTSRAEREYIRAWDWCRDMADSLIRHVKTTG